jgi:hypothetical protein
MSVPVIGDAIRSAYRNTIDSWNRATVNQILSPFGKKVSDKAIGHDLIREANSHVDQIYDGIHKQIDFTPADNFAEAAHKDLEYHLGRMADQDKGRLASVFKERVMDELYDVKTIEHPEEGDPIWGIPYKKAWTETIATPKRLTGKELQRVRSDLRTEARSFTTSQSMSERQIGYALQDANAEIGNSLMAQHPEAAKALEIADNVYAQLVRVEEASANRVGSGGRFNPNDLLSASKRLESGPRNKRYANGDALLQDWGNTSQSALSSVVANSGTADRKLWADLLTGGGVVAGGIPAAVGLGAASVPWTGPVVRAMNKAVRNPASNIAQSIKEP